MKFDKDMLVSDLIALAPEKANLLFDIGMHCIACPISQLETLEEACFVHDIDVEELLEELNSD